MIKRFWNWFSHIGDDKFATIREKKLNGIFNLCVLVGLGIPFYTFVLVGYIEYHLYLRNFENLQQYLVYFIPPVVQTVLTVFAFFLKNRTGNLDYVYIPLICGILFLFSLCILAGPNLGIHYSYFVIAPIPLFMIRRLNFITIFYEVLLFIVFIATFTVFENYPPLLPAPAEFEKVSRFSNTASSFFFLLLFAYQLWRQTRISEDRLVEEQEKSEELLLNILPESVAGELKATGKSKSVHYDGATVLFTDFVGFTGIAEKLEPAALIAEIDACFSRFDAITKRHKLEKIKTIGDSYMLAGGIPRANTTHAVDCALAALEIWAFMEETKRRKQAAGHPYWELRIGIHSGPLIAGVVGDMKFTYDVFGDTVNTASRMESSGIPGKINISADTHALVKDFFICEHRGKIAAKNKGEIDMFFLLSLKPEYSSKNDTFTPNEQFARRYQELGKS